MEITLNKNGFHRRLQVFVFGKGVPMYQSFCPYFWLTIFCGIFTFLIPIAPMFHLVKWILCKCAVGLDYLATKFDENVCEPLMQNKALKMSKHEILEGAFNANDWDFDDSEDNNFDFWRYRYFGSSVYSSSEVKQKKFEIWKSKNADWKEQIAAYRKELKKFWEEQEIEKARLRNEIAAQELKDWHKKEESKKRRQQFFTAVVKYTKWLVYVIAAAVIALVAYLAYHAYLYIADHFHWDRFVVQMKWTGIIVGCAAIVAGIIYVLVSIFKSVSCKIGCFFCKMDFKWLRPIGKAIVFIFSNIGSFFSFLWNGLVMMKKEYCPGINWK
jgi:hypothetical protein